MVTSTNPLADYTRLPADEWPWPVYWRGTTGPPVVVIHELMGLTPPVIRFADRLVDEGFTVYLPVLAGPHCATNVFGKARAAGRICVSSAIYQIKTDATSPVVTPLRRLTEYAADQAGTRAGVVGMCFSGGFALALASDEPVSAGVAAQPSLPFGTSLTRHCKRDLGLAPDDLARLQNRLASGETGVYVTRFSADWMSPRERQESVTALLGVDVDVLDSDPDNPYGFGRKDHAVLTAAPAKYAGRPDRLAAERLEQTFNQVVAFLKARLDPPADQA